MNPPSGRPRVAGRTWLPTLGAWPDGDGFRFRVWATGHDRIDVLVSDRGRERRVPLPPAGDGTFTAQIDGIGARARYGFCLNGADPRPDPCSRWQPDGVHGLSATVDPNTFPWTDAGWPGVPLDRAVFYELHVGTFTPSGQFNGVMDRLPYLADLGVTVLELMPVADFPGRRNWGYDGVCLFAPARCYGTPDDLRRLVDAAHRHGLAVVLDVVYNHFGPDGAAAFAFSPRYASPTHDSPWGAAVNFDAEGSEHVRAFVRENALHWLHEYHLDGLRFDATHAIVDDGPRHILAEITDDARASLPDRTLLLVAEDDRNLAAIVRPTAEGGWGMDAVWADDFHHHARRLSAGDDDGYFMDFSGDAGDLAETLRRGWFYVGQSSAYRGQPRGTDPAGIGPERMIICLQNHDQVGNRACGERLHHQIDAGVFRALSTLLLCAPETPLLFMGQEWAASTPFLFFTDHNSELGRLVTDGRRREFSRFAAFADERARARIPDPQAASTVEASRLDWAETRLPDHATMLAWYRALLGLRRTEPAFRPSARCAVVVADQDTVLMTRTAPTGEAIGLAARLRGHGPIRLDAWATHARPDTWAIAMTSEDQPFAPEASRHESPATWRPTLASTDPPVIQFARPAAIIVRLR
jgi:maltooligosyltrehalose trehalohydrolase